MTPLRSVNSMVPSGAKARSQGMSKPVAISLTANCTLDSGAATMLLV